MQEPHQGELLDDQYSSNSDEEYNDNYKDVLKNLSKKWLNAQLCHKVSAKATNEFWTLGMDFFHKLFQLKEREGVLRNPPQFIQQRRILFKDYCPKINMEFGYKNKRDGSIIEVESPNAPIKTLQNNMDFIKLYEIASIKVVNWTFKIYGKN